MASAGSANKICCGPKEAQQRNGSADAPFGAVAGSLSATLQEMGVPLVEHAEGMSIAGSVKGDSVENPRLFERIGGTVAVDAAVETLYQKILADESLFPLFASLQMDHLKRMQKKFLTVAFGGPSEYTGRTLKAAHEGKGIKDTQFVALAEHLCDTLEQLNLPDAQRVAIMTIVHSVKGSIVEHYDWIPAAVQDHQEACLRLGLPVLPDVPESAPSPAAVPETLAALMDLWVPRN